MISKTKQYGYIKGGKLHLMNRKRFSDDLRQMPDCDVELTIKKQGKRSTQQNRYYWAVVVEEIRLRLKELGHQYDAETLHEWLKIKFNYEPVTIEATGERLEIGRTTTELSKDEYTEFIEKIKDWAADSLDIIIPEAGEQTKLFAA